MDSKAPPPPLPLWLRLVSFCAIYLACAFAGGFLSVQHTIYQSFWLPSGLFLGTLLLHPTKEWPSFILAAMAANALFDLWEGTPLVAILFFLASNIVQSVGGAWLVRRFVAERPTVDTVKQLAGIILFAGVFSTMLGAFVGATGLSVTGLSQSFSQSWKIWWGSTGMTVVILTPFMLSWFGAKSPWKTTFQHPGRLFEAALLGASLILVLVYMLVFDGGVNTPVKSRALPLLLWAGIRFGVRGATAANLVLGILMALLVTQFQKGLTAADLASGEYVLTMQTFVAIAALVSLIPALALNERDLSLAELRDSEEKYFKAFRSSPAGILLTDLDDDRHIEVNDSFCRLYGFTHEEVIGKTSFELGILKSREECQQLVEPSRKFGFLRDFQMRTFAKTGELKTVLINTELINLGGRHCMLSVIHDITSRLAAEQRLARSRQQLRTLLSRLQTLREEERTNLAREIHDHLGQLLTALKLDLRMIERRLTGPGSADLNQAVHDKLDSSKALVDETITSVQKIASELRPAILDRLGLEAAIEVEAGAFASRAHVTCDCDLPQTPLGMRPDQATAVFRIFQELLTNIARHAHATAVSVRLSRQESGLVLDVRDNGVGMKAGALDDPNSLGLLGLQERAEILGGTINFASAATQGTKVTLQIPLQETLAKS